MNYIILGLIIIYLCYNLKKGKENFSINNKFKIVVTFYNPGVNYLKKCLKSIENQNYKNYDVCIINDKSTKEVNELNSLCDSYQKKYNWKYHENKQNGGPYKSRMEAIEYLKPENNDIIILVDGDDKLSNNNVLNILNNNYQDNTQVTFGNYRTVDYSGNKGERIIKCNNINLKTMAKNNSFRDRKGYPFSHLKTFKYGIYKNINHNDNKVNGEYIRSATDAAIMYPLLELAGENSKCINDILYDYTYDHTESLHNDENKQTQQTENLNIVKSLKKYKRIN
jgi:glycosyltransferase involved in cell wall biosynthesis